MSLRQQTVCLAALVQHAQLVDQLARTGSVDFEEFGWCVQQLFIKDFENTDSAFGELKGLKPGLQLLLGLLERTTDEHSQTVLQYAISVLHLEKQLASNTNMMQVIKSRLEHASYRNEHFATDEHSVATNVAGIYQDTLSTLSYRIQVKGNALHLQDEPTANRIRALLLCAVRAARFWRMSGGSRFKLLWSRRAFAAEARLMLSEL